MLKLEKIRAKSLLFLISGILVVSISFIFVNCGSGPMLKVSDTNKGACAIDFSLAHSTSAQAYAANAFFPSIAGNELTIDAWVKSKATSLNGGIFSRYDSKGVALWVKNNEPKFAIRVFPSGASTSTNYIVESDDTTTLIDGRWHHIAGVLVNSAHTHTTSTTCTTTVMAEIPHMDIYIDGVFKNCATTWGGALDTATGPQGVENPDKAAVRDKKVNFADIGALSLATSNNPFDGFTTSQLFEGVIDEVRLWTVARTQAQIQACMYQELNLTGGDCGIDYTILKGYWRFNECTGSTIVDSSGHGSNGWIESPSKILWSGGWVAGYPF